jgi:hypothetical protein
MISAQRQNVSQPGPAMDGQGTENNSVLITINNTHIQFLILPISKAQRSPILQKKPYQPR